MTSQVPDGYRRVTFAVIAEDGDQRPAVVSCLMCSECQALTLQNNFDDYVEAHSLWHKRMGRISDILDKAEKVFEMLEPFVLTLPVETEESLDTPADWEKMDTIIPPKRR